jgi:hypothetical protein
MRKTLTLTAAAVALTASTLTAAPAQAAGFPDARIGVAKQADGSGRTEVRVVIENPTASRITAEVVAKNTRTGKFTSRYVAVPRRSTERQWHYLVNNQRVRYTVRYLDAAMAARTVTALAPTSPWVRHTDTTCYGVGDLVTMTYGNPTAKARTFVTTYWMGDGSGKVTDRVRVPAKARTSTQVQIGNAGADTHTTLRNGTDIASFQIGSRC